MPHDDVSQTVAWRYHQATNHSAESLRQNRHGLDWPNQPRPYKRYAGALDQVPLSSEVLPSTVPALQALVTDVPAGQDRVPDATLLSTLLQLSAGITKWLRFANGTMPFRAAACTGALYHVDPYVVCGDLPGVPAGVYHFDVERVALTRLRQGDYRGVLVEATAGDERVRHAPAVLVTTSTWWRNSWKYQARTYRHAFWDSGTILANLLAVAAAHDLPARVILGFVDGAVNALLDVDPAREAALELVPLGHVSEPAPAALPSPRLNLPTQVYSLHEVDYPLIRQVHEATSLVAPDDVSAWRSAPSPLPPPREQAQGASIEAVIRRRGSAREFELSPISRDTLDALLDVAAPAAPGDWGGPLSEPYLIVNAVDGLDSGAYSFDRQTRRFEPIRLGDYRGLAGRLDLGQELARDAALNVYLLADLAAIVGRLGERGYRAAQLDASLTAGRLYLASYALNVAATGLTFFDDEVTDFFSPPAAGKSVMFLLAVGNRARR